MRTLIKNIVMKVKITGFNKSLEAILPVTLDLSELIKLYGGNYSATLPGVRKPILIDNERYTLLIYSTGLIILPNILDLGKKDIIISFVTKLIIILSKRDILKNYNNTKTFRLHFLVENLLFSGGVSQEYFKLLQRKNKDNILSNAFEKIKAKCIPKNGMWYSNKELFPAYFLKFTFNRTDERFIVSKSLASKKRKKNTLLEHKCAILVFDCGKFSFTGFQTSEDLDRFAQMITIFVAEFFLNHPKMV